jgi:hypothetical protein
MWRGAVWSLEPASVIAAVTAAGSAAADNPFFAAAPPEPIYLAWTVGWIALGLAIAIWSFARREV